MSSTLHKKLQILKDKNKIPQCLLFTGVFEGEALEFLLDMAQILSGSQKVSEALGNLYILDEELSIKIENVRELIKRLSLQNWELGKYRFVVVPQAQKLTLQSSNALLKTLEEPSQKTCFLLGAPSEKNLLPTVVSRSFVLRKQISWDVSLKKENAFSEMFFNKSAQPSKLINKLSKKELLTEWDEFNSLILEEFTTKVYSGELNKEEWHRLFDFVEELDTKIKSHMDVKWLEAAIERFGFHG